MDRRIYRLEQSGQGKGTEKKSVDLRETRQGKGQTDRW